MIEAIGTGIWQMKGYEIWLPGRQWLDPSNPQKI